MSLITKLFGGGKGNKAPTAGEAIQKLRDTEEMLIKKQDFLEKKIEQEIKIARQNGTKNKRVAIQALKRKKRYEKQLLQIDGTLSTIEMQREALEGANTNTNVLQTMGEAAKALQAAHKHMDVDKVHDMMDDIAEQQDVAREISRSHFKSCCDELMAELEELEQEALDEKLLETGEVSADLPEVPTATPAQPARKKKEAEEDPDMAELAAWAL
ncbi:Charged multivesicular body protein 4b [Armadillidium nasatum]|uniref:Charged multivesicular body protein 4b n=1 Tax=Armadillidium nasatum TaxID=96803 RepID=A0A5N5TD34_9CRUS|nr:Charged multivesicular body protein 4b [Armadillidium nasatum]